MDFRPSGEYLPFN
jgi:hypothetical protein